MNLEEEIKKKATVATNGEILAILFIFLAILFFIFPKERVQKLVLNESSNYDLSISYLKSIIATNPIKDEFKVALAEIYAKADRKKELFALLEKLDEGYFKDKESFNTYYYKLYSDKNQTTLANLSLNEIEKRITRYKKRDIKMILVDLIEKKRVDRVFIFSEIYIRVFKPDNRELEEIFTQLFYLASNEKKYKKAGFYLEILLKRDKARWAKNALYYYQDTNQSSKVIEMMEYLGVDTNTSSTQKQERLAYLYLKEKRYNKAIEAYQKLVDISPKFLDKLAYVYMEIKEYDKALEIYQKLANEGNFEDKERLAYAYMSTKKYTSASKEFERLMSLSNNKLKYFKASVDALMIEKQNGEIYNLLQKYEDLFTKDEGSATYILKLYLAINRLDGATNFSKKIFK